MAPKYPESDDRPVLGVLQWIQYQLDNNATIEEVIATDAKIRISPNNPPLHYLIADASGNAATIEFFNGKIVVHKGKDLPFPVLTNNPLCPIEKVGRGGKHFIRQYQFFIPG
jgi:choloylglycine hydrolase